MAITQVRDGGSWAGIKLAFEFLVLTAARTAEVRLATWDEIDLEDSTWTLPASRMKAGRRHRVPLSDRTLEILQGIQTTLHGFRASFRTWCGDSAQPRELAEAALAQMIPNAT